MSAQADFFPEEHSSEPWLLFRRKGGTEIRYQQLPSGALKIDFGNEDKGLATLQSNGGRGSPRLFINHPRCGGQVQRRVPEFLSALAAKVAFQDAVRNLEEKANALVRATVGELTQPQSEAGGSKRTIRELRLDDLPPPRAIDPAELGLSVADLRSMKPGDEKPFFWTSDFAFCAIDEAVLSQSEKAYAKLALLAHCKISNGVGAALYECHRGFVQHAASLSRTTLWRAEKNLSAIDLLTIFPRKEEGRKENRINCYMLRPVRSPEVVPMGNDPLSQLEIRVVSNGNNLSSGSETTGHPRDEQSSKKEQKNSEAEEEGAPAAAAVALDDWLKSVVTTAFPDWPADQVKREWECYVAKGERTGKWQPARAHFLKTWMSIAERPETNGGRMPGKRATAPAQTPAFPDIWKDFMRHAFPNDTRPPRESWAASQSSPDIQRQFKEFSQQHGEGRSDAR